MKKKPFSEIPFIRGERICLGPLTSSDSSALAELTENERVYRYIPTFLFEKRYADPKYIIDHLYDECWKESIILGIFKDNSFCGLAEFYGYREPIHKISIGYRLLERCWGQGLASETAKLMVDYLYKETDIEIITASTMVENRASENVLRKNGFRLVSHAVEEDWGYESPTIADKWIR